MCQCHYRTPGYQTNSIPERLFSHPSSLLLFSISLHVASLVFLQVFCSGTFLLQQMPSKESMFQLPKCTSAMGSSPKPEMQNNVFKAVTGTLGQLKMNLQGCYTASQRNSIIESNGNAPLFMLFFSCRKLLNQADQRLGQKAKTSSQVYIQSPSEPVFAGFACFTANRILAPSGAKKVE